MGTKISPNKWFTIFFALNVIAVVALIIWKMPATVPTHFDMDGNANNWGSKWDLLLFALLPLGIYLLIFISPIIDSRRASYTKSKKFLPSLPI